MSPQLFSPLKLRGLELRNRAVLSPMCQYQAVEGAMQDWHYEHHARFATAGLGLAFVEATGVTRDGRITHGCTGIWSDDHVPALKRVADLYRRFGVKSGIQLAHAGRRASVERPWDGAQPIKRANGFEPAWQTVGASPVAEREGNPVPRPLTVSEIEGIIEAFVQAARRALAAGFDVVEIHGAHGYLLHSFYSPLSNRRNDAFGGSRERRMRLPLLIAEAVRKTVPDDMPVFYRMSCVDNLEGGLVIDDAIALARELKALGIDAIDCSSGGMSGPATLSSAKITPGYQVPYAAAVRREAQIPTVAVGAILDPQQAEDIIADGKADLVAFGRQFIAEPHWLYRAAVELGLPDPHSVLTKYYGFYLGRRASVLDLSAHSSPR